jgi:hypothetical protein
VAADPTPLSPAHHFKATRFLGALRPTLDALDPSLANLNPLIRYLGFQKREITNFLTGPAAGLAGTVTEVAGQPAPRHALRQLSYVSPESLSIYQERLPTNRGNGYLLPRFTTDRRTAAAGIFPNFDCRPSGGERHPGDGESPPVDAGFAPCVVQRDFPRRFGATHFPGLFADR